MKYAQIFDLWGTELVLSKTKFYNNLKGKIDPWAWGQWYPRLWHESIFWDEMFCWILFSLLVSVPYCAEWGQKSTSCLLGWGKTMIQALPDWNGERALALCLPTEFSAPSGEYFLTQLCEWSSECWTIFWMFALKFVLTH